MIESVLHITFTLTALLAIGVLFFFAGLIDCLEPGGGKWKMLIGATLMAPAVICLFAGGAFLYLHLRQPSWWTMEVLWLLVSSLFFVPPAVVEWLLRKKRT